MTEYALKIYGIKKIQNLSAKYPAIFIFKKTKQIKQNNKKTNKQKQNKQKTT